MFPSICLLIEDGYYYVQIKEEKKNTTVEVLTGWNFLGMYFKGANGVQSVLDQVQLINFNQAYRQIGDLISFTAEYHDDYLLYTIFGAQQQGVYQYTRQFIGAIYDISLWVSDTFGEAFPISSLESTLVSTNCDKYCDICHPDKTTCLELDISTATQLIHGYDMADGQTFVVSMDNLDIFAGWLEMFIDVILKGIIQIKDKYGSNKIGGASIFAFA